MDRRFKVFVCLFMLVTMASFFYNNFALRNMKQKLEKYNKVREKRQTDEDFDERLRALENLVLGGGTEGLIGATGATGKNGRDVGSNSNIVKYLRLRIEEVEDTVIEERDEIQQEKKKIEEERVRINEEIEMLDNKLAGNEPRWVSCSFR